MQFIAGNNDDSDMVIVTIENENDDSEGIGDVNILLNGEIIAYFSAKDRCLVVMNMDGLLDNDTFDKLDTNNGFISVYEYDG